MRGGVSFGRVMAVAALVALGGRASAQQYKTLGPSACIACHDHARQARKWQKDEPRDLKGRAHFNTRKQLDAPKSAAFAKAIGLADPYDLKGSCVQCHSTVFKGDANAGVSCESCHGPASGYNEPHQAKGAYQKAVSLGLADLRGKPAAIAKACVDCHVTPDKRLAAAGHPIGEKFDAGASLQKIVHWNAPYDFVAVSSIGRKLAAARAASAGRAASAPPSVTAAPVVPASGGPKPAGPTAAPPRTSAPAAAAEPWDWDQPVRALPAGYVPDTAPTAAPTDAPAAAAGSAPAPSVPRRRREVPPSIAYESPLPPPVPGIVDAGPLTAAVAPAAAPEPAVSPTPSSPGDPRSRAVALLERALRAGARGPLLPAARKPAEFAGPDGELLRLQDEAMALALEALRKP